MSHSPLPRTLDSRAVLAVPDSTAPLQGVERTSSQHSRTLGQLLRHAREAQRWSLRQTAAQIRRPDGAPITPQYLHDLEHNRRHPSLHLVQELATVLHLDPITLLILAGKGLEVIQMYLREYPACATAVIRFFLLARQSGFAAWERLLPVLALQEGTLRGNRGEPLS